MRKNISHNIASQTGESDHIISGDIFIYIDINITFYSFKFD